MNSINYESNESIIARAQYERSVAIGNYIAAGIHFVSNAMGKAWRALSGLVSHKPTSRPVVGA